MTTVEQWTLVDEGWGRLAADFAVLSETGNAREYTAIHEALALRPDDELLDVACGSGFALELARIRGAACRGIDASARLVAIARDRVPDADIRVGDMNALPWQDADLDVVTSFRGIWGTTPDALDEIRRVLRPGGRLGLTVWGHIKASPGAWALRPFTLAAPQQVAHQAAMVRLGHPGVGEQTLAEHGFTDVRRVEVPFVWEFADPEHYARAIASTGPAYEAIQTVGVDAFFDFARNLAAERVRAGLPLRARLAVAGFLARRGPHGATAARATAVTVTVAPGVAAAGAAGEPSGSFLTPTPDTGRGRRLLEEDVTDLGYVMNATRLWARLPGALDGLFGLLRDAAHEAGLTPRERGVLVVACASTLGDSYCSLAWGGKLAAAADPTVAAAVLAHDDTALDERERALTAWARAIASAPNDTTPADVDALRAARFSDQQIFAITLFVALRVAFSGVNDALGAHPDAALVASLPDVVRDRVTWGRPPDTG